MFVAHWEVARFCVVTGRRFFGLLPRVERWQPHFPHGFRLETYGVHVSRNGPAQYLFMRVLATLGPKGAFGHMGICSRELAIVRVLEAHETTDPGPRGKGPSRNNGNIFRTRRRFVSFVSHFVRP